MSRASLLILLGVLLFITPFSGLPSVFRTLLTVVFATLVMGIGFAIRLSEVRSAKNASMVRVVEGEAEEVEAADAHQSSQKLSPI